jgi:hypothetical protein
VNRGGSQNNVGYPLHFVTLGEQDVLAEGGYVVLVDVPDPLRARLHSRSSSEEVTLNWNKWIRQTHRWLSMAFTVAVIINIVAIAQKKYTASVGLLAVIPLALQFFTGLYLFVLPYATKWRSGRSTD